MTGIVFDIQTYAIHDGPGIRTCVYFKGCPLHCYWCHNPESQRLEAELGLHAERCGLCGDCVEACPSGARTLKGGRIIHDPQACSACGACALACPNDAVELVGYQISAKEVASKVEEDRAFFANSGGGVTITGGEPTVQAGFLLEVLGELKEAGIHTAIETCGMFPKRLAPDLVDQVDLFLFDIKHLSQSAHRQATGSGNRQILDNYRTILGLAGQDRVIPRIPLVPGFNSDPESIANLADFMTETRSLGPIHLMPYHGLAGGKYKMLGKSGPSRATKKPSQEMLARITKQFTDHGLKPVLHGAETGLP
jgi:pyruvate formate lyase activating enzyme